MRISREDALGNKPQLMTMFSLAYSSLCRTLRASTLPSSLPPKGRDRCYKSSTRSRVSLDSMVGIMAGASAGNDDHGVIERTLALIKPDAWHRAKEIEEEIRAAGFAIFAKRDVLLTEDQCADFYMEHVDKPFFDDLIEYITSGTCRVLILSGPKAISRWRQLIGPTDVERARRELPTSIRARYGGGKAQNAVHGSDSFTSAEREIHFFFPDQPVSVADQVRSYLAHEVNPTLTSALAELCQAQPDDPVFWLAQWLKDNNPNSRKTN